MKYRVLALACSALLLSAGETVAEVPSVIAIRGARIVTVSGPVIARGAVILRDGLIEAVGDAQPPPGAWIIDGEGLTVYPGLLDALSTLGLPDTPSLNGTGRPNATRPQGAPPAVPRGPEDRPLNTSYLRAADELSPTDRRLEAARNAGFTGAVTFPTQGVFAGLGAVIDLAGKRPGQMVVQSPAGLYLTTHSGGFGSGYPSSLMGVIAYIRQIYLDAGQYKTAKAIYAAHPKGLKRPGYDKWLEGVLEAPRVLLPARDPKEMERMLRLGEELNLKVLLYGLAEGFRAPEILKNRNAQVLVNLRWPEKPRAADPEAEETLRDLETRDLAPSTPAALVKAGVKFAFYAGALEKPSDVAPAIRRAMNAGLSHDNAVRALTLNVAELYGVSDRLGSVEKGKIANLVVTRGDLFRDKTEVKYVFVDGIKYEPAAEAPAPAPEVTR
ncbi:MAG: amidohydrolase family protein [Bryobacterales bacterium]|nr:amidohydrolase family protein [Bryobacterales bacterium]